MKKVMVLLLGILLLTGCATSKGDLMSTDVVFFSRSSLTESYYKEKTYLFYHNDKEPYLRYIVKISDRQWFELYLNKGDIPKLDAILDKYLEWNDIAVRDNDLINKHVAANVKFDADSNYAYYFTIVPYDQKTHLLRIEACDYRLLSGTVCSTNYPVILYIGPADAEHLKSDLNKFNSGDFKAINYDKYK